MESKWGDNGMETQTKGTMNIGKTEKKEQKKIFPKKGKSRCSQKTTEKQRISWFDNKDNPRNRKGISEKALNETALSVGVERVRTLANCLLAIGHPTRLEIVKYCLEPRRFTDIILNLRLNPASFKFHSKVLMDCDLIGKVERGVYETTKLGKLLLELVNQANRLAMEKKSA